MVVLGMAKKSNLKKKEEPKLVEEPIKQVETTPTTNSAFQDAQKKKELSITNVSNDPTGKKTITLPDGRTFFGANEDTVNAIKEQEARRLNQNTEIKPPIDQTQNIQKGLDIVNKPNVQDLGQTPEQQSTGSPITDTLKKVTELMGAEFDVAENGQLSLRSDSIPNILKNAAVTGATASFASGLITKSGSSIAASSEIIKGSSNKIIRGILGAAGITSTSGYVISNANSITSEVNKYSETISNIKQGVDLGEDPYKALEQLNQINSSLDEAEKALKSTSLSTIYLTIFGKIRAARLEVSNQRDNVQNQQIYILNKIASGQAGRINIG